jgi:hypothetical protein
VTRPKLSLYNGIFIGYFQGSNGYRFYDLRNKKLIKTRDALFLDQDTPRHAKRAREKLLATPTESDVTVVFCSI